MAVAHAQEAATARAAPARSPSARTPGLGARRPRCVPLPAQLRRPLVTCTRSDRRRTAPARTSWPGGRPRACIGLRLDSRWRTLSHTPQYLTASTDIPPQPSLVDDV